MAQLSEEAVRSNSVAATTYVHPGLVPTTWLATQVMVGGVISPTSVQLFPTANDPLPVIPVRVFVNGSPPAAAPGDSPAQLVPL